MTDYMDNYFRRRFGVPLVLAGILIVVAFVLYLCGVIPEPPDGTDSRTDSVSVIKTAE